MAEIPAHIVAAVDSLLSPYGVDFADVVRGGTIEPQIYISPRQASVMSGRFTPKTIRDFALLHKFKSKRSGHPTRGRVMIDRKDFRRWLDELPDQ